MYIHEIRIAKLRHIENVVIGPLKFNSKSSETFVFAGPNGGGKSSLLELIGYALSNSYSLGWSLSRTFEGFSFEVAIGLDPNEVNEVTNTLNDELNVVLKRIEEQKKTIEDNISLQLEQKAHQIQRLNDQQKPNLDSLKGIIKYRYRRLVVPYFSTFTGGKSG